MSKHEDASIGRRLRTSYISTVVSISLVLYVLGLLGLVVFHAKKLSDYVKENIGFSVILTETAREADVIYIQKTLDASVHVKSTEYISKDKAAQILMEDLGEDFVSFLGYNPLSPSIEVKLNAQYANPDSLQIFEKELLKNNLVQEVYYPKSLVHLVNENVKRIGLVLMVFCLFLLIISFSLINNTIRLSVFARRFLIKSMQLVGATQSFIRRPFVTQGVVQGIAGSALAIILLMLTLYFAQKSMPELIDFQDVFLYLSIFGGVIIFGMIISWISTWFAVKKYLKIKTDSLYYY